MRVNCAAVTARGHAEAERKQLAEQLAAAREGQPAGGDDTRADLQRELDRCREQLAAAGATVDIAPGAPAAASSAEPIPLVSAAGR